MSRAARLGLYRRLLQASRTVPLRQKTRSHAELMVRIHFTRGAGAPRERVGALIDEATSSVAALRVAAASAEWALPPESGDGGLARRLVRNVVHVEREHAKSRRAREKVLENMAPKARARAQARHRQSAARTQWKESLDTIRSRYRVNFTNPQP